MSSPGSRAVPMRAAAAALLCVVARPAGAQLAPERLAAIDSFFARSVSPAGPGCAWGLIRGDSLVDWRGYGRADVDSALPFTPETGFHPGSIYKHFYAASLVLLERQGRISLDDDIRKHLPELPDYGTPVTVRDLVTHTHGLREYRDLLEFTPPQTVVDEATILRLLSRQRSPAAPAGTRFRYGNTGPDLAAIIIRRASGLSAAGFTAHHVLDPAGMRLTAFGTGDSTRPIPPRVAGHVRQPDGTATRRPPAAGSRTTLQDLARWNGRFESDDPEWQSLLRRLTEPTALRDGSVLDVGMSLRLSPYRGLRRVWAPGGASGFRAMFMRFPDAGLAIALGCNHEGVNPVQAAEVIADQVLAAEIVRAERPATGTPVRPTQRQLRRLAGTYVSTTGHVLRVVMRDGRLYTAAGAGEFDMVPAGPGRFTYPGHPVIAMDPALEARFQPGRRGTARTLELRTNWDPILFSAVKPVDRRTVVPGEYAGVYASDEVESALEVAVREGGMVLRTARGEFSLQPVSRDLFQAGPQLVRFTRERGRVTAAAVSRGAIPFLAFTRQPG